MIPTPADGVARLMGHLVRRADASLAHRAARNAAASVADGRTRRLDELRTLRDLRALETPAGALPPRRHHPRRHA